MIGNQNGRTLKTRTARGSMFKPTVLVFAGPNGSGKSTIARVMPHYGVYVNADDLKKEYALTDLDAAQKAEALRNKLAEKRVDFTFETVLSTERNLLLLQNAKVNGYEVQCVYVLTYSVDINVARVRGRVSEGGHDVPESKIRSRYVKALELLPRVIDVCDKMLIYDNSVMPFLVFRKDENGSAYFPTEIWSLKKLHALLKR